jgi:hypothetical protein
LAENVVLRAAKTMTVNITFEASQVTWRTQVSATPPLLELGIAAAGRHTNREEFRWGRLSRPMQFQ